MSDKNIKLNKALEKLTDTVEEITKLAQEDPKLLTKAKMAVLQSSGTKLQEALIAGLLQNGVKTERHSSAPPPRDERRRVYGGTRPI